MIFLIIGFILSYYLYINICSYGPKKTSCCLKFNRIKINNVKLIHLHHWIIHLFLLLFYPFIYNKILRDFYIGINLGGVYHGIISYDDWYKIIK